MLFSLHNDVGILDTQKIFAGDSDDLKRASGYKTYVKYILKIASCEFMLLILMSQFLLIIFLR